MTNNRGATILKPIKTHLLCSGPSNLCKALAITKQDYDKIDLCTSQSIEIYEYLKNDTILNDDLIIACERVGISTKTGKWTTMPWRFYIDSSKSVSVRKKK
jgi:3-methyladenine DNA glycosylase Mpg